MMKTKADILFTLVKLKPELVKSIDILDTFTVPQLKAMVRSIVHDINRVNGMIPMPGLTL